MFTLKELEEDATLLLDLKEDVREECETIGEVTNVTLYDVRRLLSLSLFLDESAEPRKADPLPRLVHRRRRRAS